jgi:predicted unusual protein kinase regulating ubiquinone biosynthesis (AarF/ABC1/UbiB family)
MADEKDNFTNDESKNSQSKIPTSKVQRATEFVKTGVKIGGNYIKHYAKKAVNPDLDRSSLDEDNAKDIYESLSQLKGSALKVAQMMSMDKSMLPKAYSEQFSMAQHSAKPLSYPLIVNTFKKYFDKSPTELFDTFTKDAVNAASIGQVHKATKDGKNLAVKVQYPGVAESVSSDLKMVKPLAVQLLNLSEKDVDLYMSEVEQMLIAETDYDNELRQSKEISAACGHIKNLQFATYYPEFSCKRVLTMDWLAGVHLADFLATNPSQELRNQVGQALWDFYDYQMHELMCVHADPHPGNFLMQENGNLAVLDFGCVKVIPKDYYYHHFQVINPELFVDDAKLSKVFIALKFIYEEDNAEDRKYFFDLFKEMLAITLQPFRTEVFDFGNDEYFAGLYAFGEILTKSEKMRKSKKPRGSKDSLYLNRTYFGLYTMLHDLKAQVNTNTTWRKKYEESLGVRSEK